MQACAGTHDHYRSALGLALHVMRSQSDGVHDTAEVDIQSVFVGFLQLSIRVNSKAQVVSAWTDSSIRKNVVDLSVLFLSCFEDPCQVTPLSYIS
jgi:hypothetical protein